MHGGVEINIKGTLSDIVVPQNVPGSAGIGSYACSAIVSQHGNPAAAESWSTRS